VTPILVVYAIRVQSSSWPESDGFDSLRGLRPIPLFVRPAPPAPLSNRVIGGDRRDPLLLDFVLVRLDDDGGDCLSMSHRQSTVKIMELRESATSRVVSPRLMRPIHPPSASTDINAPEYLGSGGGG
jgi:hypothetical protein